MSIETADILALASLFIALASFFISLYTYRVNSGLLQVSISVGEVRNGETLEIEEEGFYLKVICSGHRPVIFSAVGGDLSNSLMRGLGSLFPGWIKPKAFFLSGVSIRPIVFTDATSSNFRVMNEG